MSSGKPHLERTANEPRDKDLHLVTISQIDQVNDQVRLLRLSLKTGPMKFLPGQWLDVYVPDVPKAGGFTITSPPSAAQVSKAPSLELAIQKGPVNPTAWLWKPEDEILGSEIQIRVGGSFVFPPPGILVGELRKVVFVAGGVGINPLMSMMGFIAEGKYDLEVELLYASKVQGGCVRDVLFFDRLAMLFGEGKLRGKLRLFATSSSSPSSAAKTEDEIKEISSEANLSIQARRFTTDDIKAALGADNQAGKLVYICGPPSLTDDMFKSLTSSEDYGLDSSRVLIEKWW